MKIRQRWINKIFHTTALIDKQKKQLLMAHRLKGVIIILKIITLELGLAIISLPTYLYLVPLKLNSSHKQYEKTIKGFRMRRALTFSAIIGFIALWVIKLIIIPAVSLILIPKVETKAAVSGWDFDIAGDYTYDASMIEVSGNTAKLIVKDQTDDDNANPGGFGQGVVNEMQWDVANNWMEMTALGQINGNGDYT